MATAKLGRFGASVWRQVRSFDARKPVHLVVAGVVVAGIAAPAINWLVEMQSYHLSTAESRVIAKVSPNYASKLAYDSQKRAAIFNADGQTQTQSSSPDTLLTSAGAGGKKDSQLYTATLPEQSTSGIVVHDNVNNVSVTFTPQFSLDDGKMQYGRSVYPLKDNNGKLVLTPKANGLKEDILLTSAPKTDAVVYHYKLDIPDYLDAKLMDDGSVGIYSADPALFGKISYGADTDRTAVEKARKNSDKTYLMFRIPAPTVEQTGKAYSGVSAAFTLNGNDLAVNVHGLSKASYPLSIDPTFVLTSTTDFVLGSIDDNIDLSVADQVGRQTLVGGSTPGWTPNSAPNLAYAQFAAGLVAYNGFLYIIGGGSDNAASGTTTNDVYYISLNPTTGALGGGTPATWTATSSMITARQGLVAFGFNGYLYAAGGQDNSGVPLTAGNSVEYAKIGSTGAVGAWAHTSNLNTVRAYPAGAIYQGVLYVMGGTSGTNNATPQSTMEYARINGNGTVGTWTQSTSSATGTLTSARSKFTGGAYNGYLYVAGGQTSTTVLVTGTSLMQYAPILADGSVGTWVNTTAFPTARRDHGMAINNGYIYVFGGCTGAAQACAGFLGDTQYAVINADGTIGQWQSTVPYNTGGFNSRMPGGYTSYSNHLYFTGGCSAETATNNCGTQLVGTFITNIDDVGRFDRGLSTAGTPPYTGTSTVARTGGQSVALNGYVYYAGGCSVSNCATFDNTVEYATLNADGTLGNFAATTSMPGDGNQQGRMGHTMAAFHDQVYAIGGVEHVYGTTPTAAAPTVSTIASSTTHNVAMPATVAAGDLLLVIMDYASNTEPNLPAGWTRVTHQQRGTVPPHIGVYAKVAAGTEGGTNVNWSSGTAHTLVAQVYRVTAAQWFGNIASGIAFKAHDHGAPTGTTVDPDPLTPAWGIDNTLWIAAAGGATNTAATSYPSGYTGGTFNTTGAGATGSSLATAKLANTVATEDPGIFTLVTASAYVSYTLAIRPPTGATTYESSVMTATQTPSTGVLGAWSTQTALGGHDLPAARAFHTTEMWHNYVYVLGGRDASTVYGTVYYAPIDSAGLIGTWNTATTGITARWGASGGAWGKWLYVVSGQTNTTGTYIGTTSGANAVQRLTVNESTGDISSATGFASGTATRFAGGFVHNGFLYAVGGDQSAAVTANIAWSELDATTGAPAAFVTTNIGNRGDLTAGIATARSMMGAVETGGYMYVFGGCTVSITNTSFTACTAFVSTANTTEMYLPNNGGTGQTSVWAAPNSMGTARADFNAVAYNGYLYAIGGCATFTSGVCSSAIATTESAVINPDGTLGTWTAQTSLPVGKNGGQAMVYNGILYAISGRDSSSVVRTVYYAPISATGTIGTWVDNSANYVPSGQERFTFGGAVSNGYIYIAGGRNSGGTRLNTVYYAQTTIAGPLAADAGCGSVWCSTTSFTGIRSALNLVAYNDVLYVIGGIDSTSIPFSDIQYAPLAANGTVGTWNYTSEVSQAQSFNQAVAANGYMYFLGDSITSTENNYAAINANGTLGPVMNIVNNMLARHDRGAAAFYDGFFYNLGGCGSFTGVNCNPKTGTDMGGQQAISRVGHYSKLFNTQVDTSPTQLVINGAAASGNSAVEFQFQTASTADPVLGVAQLIRPVVFGQFYNVQALNSSGTNVGVAFNYKYTIVLDDSRSGTFPDIVKSGFSQTAVTDITLYYHANPARRLRHGASFTDTACNPIDVTQGCILDTAP